MVLDRKVSAMLSVTFTLFAVWCMSPVFATATRVQSEMATRERRVGDTGSRRDADEDSRKLLEKMVNAVEIAMKFFSEDYSSINVDGLFGIRVGQGQLKAAMEECSNSSSCPNDLLDRFKALIGDIDRTGQAALKYVEEADPDYLTRFMDTVDKPYLLRYRPQKLKDLEKTPAGNDDHYEENTGDACLSRILGTYRDHGKVIDACNVTDECWDMMTASGGSRYAITHQLLYFTIIEKKGCLEKVESTMGAKVQDTQQRMCGSIYNEVVAEVKDGSVPDVNQDLFLEQVLLCGILGFEDFMHDDWMRIVLTWQKPTGCFSLDDQRTIQIQKMFLDYKHNAEHVMADLKNEAEMIEDQHHGRQLMREKIMRDGCMAHKTGLGFGTLCLFTRYLIRHNFPIP